MLLQWCLPAPKMLGSNSFLEPPMDRQDREFMAATGAKEGLASQ